MSRQKAEGKEILKVRLSSFDMGGLGLSRAKGHTLVQYAGSLNGADFRLILQLAPSVLQGLIPDAAYQAWLALCRLAPLLFQPQISNLESYLVSLYQIQTGLSLYIVNYGTFQERLKNAIDDFLAATALWNTRWFNKPKFHIILHIIQHIPLFGPAMLYATETFESFNFVIRARSIHSNRHAPSVDIANSFSHMHAVRHLVSGGYLFITNSNDLSPNVRRAGREILNLVKDEIFVKLMGMKKLFSHNKQGEHQWTPQIWILYLNDITRSLHFGPKRTRAFMAIDRVWPSASATNVSQWCEHNSKMYCCHSAGWLCCPNWWVCFIQHLRGACHSAPCRPYCGDPCRCS